MEPIEWTTKTKTKTTKNEEMKGNKSNQLRNAVAFI